MNFWAGGKVISETLAKVLQDLSKGPVPLEAIHPRSVATLEKRGWITLEVEEAKITAKGKTIAEELKAKGPPRPVRRKRLRDRGAVGKNRSQRETCLVGSPPV